MKRMHRLIFLQYKKWNLGENPAKLVQLDQLDAHFQITP
jgi:hypothetical protein